MKNRPETTLFMLMSVDGKISTGDTDAMDFDKDLPRIKGVREGLHQYYELDKKTDLYTLNSGRVLQKVGANEKKAKVAKIPVSFIVIDNKPHLNSTGIDYLLRRGKKLYIVTTNKAHPAFKRKSEKNLHVIYYPNKIDFQNLFLKLKKHEKIRKITIQTGGTLNAVFLRQGLIDHISIVVAPALIGGKDTSTVIDGESLHSVKELVKIKALKLRKCKILKNSYLHLFYDVINKKN